MLLEAMFFTLALFLVILTTLLKTPWMVHCRGSRSGWRSV